MLAWPLAAQSVDYVPAPPPTETVRSPNGAYRFEIAVAARSRSDPSIGTLRAHAAREERTVWQRSLPQRVRPRYATVADDGTVVLLDQYDNIFGPIAILVIDPKGSDVAALSFDAIAGVARVSRAQIAARARHGAWIETPPVLVGSDVRVGVGGVVVAVDLRSGQARQVEP